MPWRGQMTTVPIFGAWSETAQNTNETIFSCTHIGTTPNLWHPCMNFAIINFLMDKHFYFYSSKTLSHPIRPNQRKPILKSPECLEGLYTTKTWPTIVYPTFVGHVIFLSLFIYWRNYPFPCTYAQSEHYFGSSLNFFLLRKASQTKSPIPDKNNMIDHACEGLRLGMKAPLSSARRNSIKKRNTP